MFDTGNTGFMLVAISLVMLMTPGPLAFFYGGLVGRELCSSISIFDSNMLSKMPDISVWKAMMPDKAVDNLSLNEYQWQNRGINRSC